MAENDGEMAIDDLSAVYRMESNSPQLTAIRKDFYVAAQQLIEKLSKECDRLLTENPDSIMYDGAVQKKKKALENLKKIVEKRMEKIAGMALRGARGANNVIDGLTAEEKDYYNSVLEDSKEFWKLSSRKKKVLISQDITRADEPQPVPVPEPAAVDDVPLSEIPVDDFPEDMGSPAEEIVEDEEEQPVPEPVIEEVPAPAIEPVAEPVPTPEPVQAPEIDDDSEVVVRILEDLPPFSGPEVDYDLKKEDIVRMPGVMAKALINRGKARIVTTA